MKDDTISRRGAIKAIEEMGFQKTSTVKAILCRLETLPSAQSEIVRCRDCKHGRLFAQNCVDCEYRELATDADWFCADGERRTDE